MRRAAWWYEWIHEDSSVGDDARRGGDKDRRVAVRGRNSGVEAYFVGLPGASVRAIRQSFVSGHICAVIERKPMSETSTDHKAHTPFFSRPGVRRLAPFVLITAIALIFIFETRGSVKSRLLIPEVTMPLWGALLIAWGLGMLACAFTVRRRTSRHTRQKK
jgi:uncharacterized integral membrane protein